MGNTASNVSAGKPAVAGAIWVAPVGTELPTDVSTELDGAFACLGYCSEEGLTNSTNMETEKIKAWGGDTVLVINKSKDDTFKYTLIESLNVAVLEFVYGADNVSGDLDTGIAISVKNEDLDEVSVVIEQIMRNNTLKRIVIPACKVSEVGDIVYSDSEPVGYETTVDCTPDSDGCTHYEYIKKVATSA